MTRRGGPLVTCSVCGWKKKPLGRDPGLAAANGFCDHECAGYRLDPVPDTLWPGEPEEEVYAQKAE